MPLDNKISNIIGAKLPQWVLNQIGTRSNKNTQESRVNDNDNILYLANKTAWVRLVSSVDIMDQRDLNYFKKLGASLDSTTASIFGINIDLLNPSSLAKQYVLFGGTAKYLNKNSYQLRSGIGSDGAYGMLGTEEIQKYGYKPMPGITSVNIETQGRLGSVRAATINFKCWDKAQLDIMDALYFKLGFTMFLEWGHTYFYYSPDNSKKRDPNKVFSTDVFSLDPFQANLSKEKILSIVAKNSRESEGNYDGMLGMVTNFNFTYTQDGGYDCTIRLMALGALADGIKINNPLKLPDLLKEEIIELNNTLIQIATASDVKNKEPEADSGIDSIFRYLNKKAFKEDKEPDEVNKFKITANYGILGSEYTRTLNPPVFPPYEVYDFIYNDTDYTGLTLYLQKFGIRIPEKDTSNFVSEITIDREKLSLALVKYYAASISSDRSNSAKQLQIKNGTLLPPEELFYFLNEASVLSQLSEYLSFPIPYKGNNGKYYFIQIGVKIPSGTEYSYLNEINNARQQGFIEGSSGKIIINKKPSDIFKQVIKDIYFGSFGTDSFSSIKLDIVEDATIPSNFSLARTSALDTVPLNVGNLNLVTNSTIQGKENFSISLIGNFTIEAQVQEKTAGGSSYNTISKPTSANGTITITITDTSLIKSIKPTFEETVFSNYFTAQKNLVDQNKEEEDTPEEQRLKDEAISTQITQALNYQSSLEIILRTIQLHSLNRAIKKRGLNIENKVYVQELWNPNDVSLKRKSKKSFLEQIFANGIFSSFIKNLVNDDIVDLGYEDADGNPQESLDEKKRLQIQSKYGFATNLMANKASLSEIKDDKVNFKELLKAYVVPYEINQEIAKGVQTNHPVYIPLGQLLMLLNHTCTIYDTNKKSNFQTPLVYIDFNPNLNYCLTNTKQLSTNPWVTLIPFQGSFKDYTELFDEKILNDPKTQILPLTGNREGVNLFNPENKETGDTLSGALPKFKFTGKNGNVYRGSIMNILLNIDYLIKLAQDYSTKDESHSVYLKPYIEKILSDVNKYLGDFNAFRLSYNDQGNTFQIVDDQLVPGLPQEPQISPTKDQITPTNRTELPLLGKFSIAKSLEIKTDISNKLSNMIAISANSTIPNKAVLSVNGDPFGYINTNYVDRYINDKLDPGGNTDINKQLDTVKTSAAQFNQAISDFYNKINPSEATVAHATNYYIERMSKIKNNEYATRASTLIPVSINFTTDGISGLAMGQGFTVPDELLPYTYNVKKLPGLPKDHVNNTGFVVVGLSHTIENNSWNTSVRANMLFLKDKTEFKGAVEKVEGRVGTFGINAFNALNTPLQNNGPCTRPYKKDNLNKGWPENPVPLRTTVIDPSKEGPILKGKYGTTLAKNILALIKVEQNNSGFNNNYGGYDITSGGWSYNPIYHNGWVVAREGGTELCKAYISFISFEKFVEQTVDSFKKKGLDTVNTAEGFANLWYEKWNGREAEKVKSTKSSEKLRAEAKANAVNAWNSINI